MAHRSAALISRTIVALVLAMVFALPCAAIDLSDTEIEYSTLSRQVGSMLVDGAFSRLEAMAVEQRSYRSRFSDGRWKLTALYDGMSPERGRPLDQWRQYELQLRHWIDREGASSATPHVALASFYVARAWQARGAGYANAVTPEGWRDFRRDLQLARAELTRSAPISQRCPHWFNVMQQVALGQGWEEDAYEALFEQAVSREPSYYFYYFSKANFYQSRWYGNRETLRRFVDDAVARSYKAEGFTLYARIYWASSREFGVNMFAPGNVDWSKMKAGFEFMNKEYPNSNWNMNAFAHFACLARDKATTRRALSEVGDAIAIGAWDSAEEMEHCRRWAAAP